MFWLTGLLGLVLALAPFVFGFSTVSAALWTCLILGAIILVVSGIGAVSPQADTRWMHWVNGLAGLAALIAPFIFGYNSPGSAMWTGIVLGGMLVVIELVGDAVSSVEAPAR